LAGKADHTPIENYALSVFILVFLFTACGERESGRRNQRREKNQDAFFHTLFSLFPLNDIIAGEK
jgi:hypothetical protein